MSMAVSASTSAEPESVAPAPASVPVHLFGHSVYRWHDRFWAVRRCEVVRAGQSQAAPRRGLYLLLPPESLIMVPMGPVSELMNWVRPKLLSVRLHRAIPAKGGADRRQNRCYWTGSQRLAQRWADSDAGPLAHRDLRRTIPARRRWSRRLAGSLYHASNPQDATAWLTRLMQANPDPTTLLAGPRQHESRIYAPPDADIPAKAHLTGPLWIGHNHYISPDTRLTGPRVLPDRGDSPENPTA